MWVLIRATTDSQEELAIAIEAQLQIWELE